jgi:hypothetical protein
MHYENGKGYDVIDFITDYGLNFNKGNIIKYVARAGKKGDELSDLRKALRLHKQRNRNNRKTKKRMGSEPRLIYLKVLLLGQLTLEAMDELNGTSKYKHNLKLNGQRFSKQLEAHIKADYDLVYSNDPEMATNVLNKLESLIDKLRTSDVDELVMIDAIIDKYHDNKEWFKEHADAEFLRLQ